MAAVNFTEARYPDRIVGDARSVRVIIPANTTIIAGECFYVAPFLGVVMENVTNGAGVTKEVALSIGPLIVATTKLTSDQTFAKGTAVYWDADNQKFTETPGSIRAGYVYKAKGSESTPVAYIFLDGGIKGEPGAAGADGADGAAGADGADGEDGAAGSASTIPSAGIHRLSVNSEAGYVVQSADELILVCYTEGSEQPILLPAAASCIGRIIRVVAFLGTGTVYAAAPTDDHFKGTGNVTPGAGVWLTGYDEYVNIPDSGAIALCATAANEWTVLSLTDHGDAL